MCVERGCVLKPLGHVRVGGPARFQVPIAAVPLVSTVWQQNLSNRFIVGARDS
jgi:hypothetical protein